MNYTQITDAAIAYADRENSTQITNNLPMFIGIVEARVARKLATQNMSVTAVTPIVTDQDTYALPIDFMSQRAINLVESGGARSPAQYLNPSQFAVAQNLQPISMYGYMIANRTIQIVPIPDDTNTLEIIYFRRIPPLTITAPDNWLSDIDPDCYIFGLLVEISSFVKDANAAQLWEQRFLDSLAAIDFQDAVSTWSGTALTIKVG